MRDARRASLSGETDFVADRAGFGRGETEEGPEEFDEGPGEIYRLGGNQIIAGSKDVTAVVQKLCRFQQVALGSVDELRATILPQGKTRRLGVTEGAWAGAYMPEQRIVKSIKSQQKSLSREKERRIQGTQGQANVDRAG
jgi:hypothetical protein